MRILLALLGNVLALLATTIVPGITFNGNLLTLVVAGIIFGLFNAIVRPIVLILSIPFLIVTLGLFYFLINGVLLYVASLMIPGYRVDGLIAGILGGLVLMVANWILGALLKKPEEKEARE
jgi:putative membrane protein